MANLLWLQGGACSGNTMSFLNAEEPSACDLVTDFGINVLWHPSLGIELGENLKNMLDALRLRRDRARHLRLRRHGGERAERHRRMEPLRRPGDEGLGRRPRQGRDLHRRGRRLRHLGRHPGDRAEPVREPRPAVPQARPWRLPRQGLPSKAGLPVINIPGCPAHPDWITQIVVAVATGRGGDLTLDEFQRPKTFFTSFTQTGCTRNMHFAYKVSATEFGQRKGCLFYDLGCRGPMTHSPCNRILWNRVSSKTRAGMPCMGCTEPEFPFFDLAPGTVFKTQTVMGVPKDMPAGVDKTGYVKLTAAAKAASPAWAEEDLFVV